MIGLEYCRTMARYNRWMNEKLYAVCAELSDAERRRDRGAFFASVHGTLNHLLAGDRLWLGRFTDQPFALESLDQELYTDFEELRRERARTDDDIDAWIGRLTEDALAGTLTYQSFVDPQQLTFPLWKPLVHFFNHQTHHRGQLTTLLSQAGRDPGVTDLIWLPEPEQER